MPSMLGWFSLKPETTLEDIEWMLARGAGFNAGFALSTSIEAIKKNGRADEIFAAVKLWETARAEGVFPESQQQRMQDIKNEFHLEAGDAGTYKLLPVHNAYFTYEQVMKQPGEPTFSTFLFKNEGEKQPVAFIISMAMKNDSDPDVTFDNPSLVINQQDALILPINLKRTDILYCDGNSLKRYNKQWQLQETISLTKPLPVLSAGDNAILFDGKYSGSNGPDIKIEVRSKGAAELLKKN